MVRIKTFIWTVLLVAGSFLFSWGIKPEIIDKLNFYASVEAPNNFIYNTLNTYLGFNGGPYILSALIFGCALLLLCILLLFLGSKGKPTGSIILKKAKGNVEVKLASVQECLVRAAKRDPDVKAAKISFSGKGRKMKIHVNTTIWEMPDVPSKVEQLQFMLENRFNELMGPLSDDIRIDVILKKIAARKDGEYPDQQKSIETGFDQDLENLDIDETKDYDSDKVETVDIKK